MMTIRTISIHDHLGSSFHQFFTEIITSTSVMSTWSHFNLSDFKQTQNGWFTVLFAVISKSSLKVPRKMSRCRFERWTENWRIVGFLPEGFLYAHICVRDVGQFFSKIEWKSNIFTESCKSGSTNHFHFFLWLFSLFLDLSALDCTCIIFLISPVESRSKKVKILIYWKIFVKSL